MNWASLLMLHPPEPSLLEQPYPHHCEPLATSLLPGANPTGPRGLALFQNPLRLRCVAAAGLPVALLGFPFWSLEPVASSCPLPEGCRVEAVLRFHRRLRRDIPFYAGTIVSRAVIQPPPRLRPCRWLEAADALRVPLHRARGRDIRVTLQLFTARSCRLFQTDALSKQVS